MISLNKKIVIIFLGLILFFTGCQQGMPSISTLEEIKEVQNLSQSELIEGPTFSIDNLTRGVSNSPYLKVSQSGDRIRVDVNLRPSGYTHYEGAIVEVKAKASTSGWQLNIGNSPTNNGYGGDSGSTKYDSELQILNNNLTAYRNDFGGSGLFKTVNGFGAERRFSFQIENNKVSIKRYNFWGTYRGGVTISDPNFFDFNAAAGYEFHVGINRTITSSRYGLGMHSLTIKFIKPKTGIYIAGNSVANYPGSYTLGHMGLIIGSDTNNLGWHFFSIERDNAPYILPGEILWKAKLPAIATGSVAGGAKYSVLYHHRESSKNALFEYLKKNAPGVNNSGQGIIVGQGYDRIAQLKRYNFADAKRFLAYVMAYPASTYNVINNNCATFSTYAIEEFYNVECNDNSWHVPNHLFDDLYNNPSFTIISDNRLDK